MELVWTDMGLMPSAYAAVCAFTGCSTRAGWYQAGWEWTDESRGEFKAGPDLYRVRHEGGKWLIYKLVTPGGA